MEVLGLCRLGGTGVRQAPRLRLVAEQLEVQEKQVQGATSEHLVESALLEVLVVEVQQLVGPARHPVEQPPA